MLVSLLVSLDLCPKVAVVVRRNQDFFVQTGLRILHFEHCAHCACCRFSASSEESWSHTSQGQFCTLHLEEKESDFSSMHHDRKQSWQIHGCNFRGVFGTSWASSGARRHTTWKDKPSNIWHSTRTLALFSSCLLLPDLIDTSQQPPLPRGPKHLSLYGFSTTPPSLGHLPTRLPQLPGIAPTWCRQQHASSANEHSASSLVVAISPAHTHQHAAKHLPKAPKWQMHSALKHY